MTGHAFVYGTLMAPEVLTRLIKRVPRMQPATIRGYTRYKVKGAVFPAILATEPSAMVEGQVLFDLTEPELVVLDKYESVEYERVTVTPELQDGTTVTADVYVWKAELKSGLQPEPWDYEQWRAANMHAWVRQTAPHAAHPGGGGGS